MRQRRRQVIVGHCLVLFIYLFNFILFLWSNTETTLWIHEFFNHKASLLTYAEKSKSLNLGRLSIFVSAVPKKGPKTPWSGALVMSNLLENRPLQEISEGMPVSTVVPPLLSFPGSNFSSGSFIRFRASSSGTLWIESIRGGSWSTYGI